MQRFQTKRLIVEAEYAVEGQMYLTADGFKRFTAGVPLVKRVFDGKAIFEEWTVAEFEEIFEPIDEPKKVDKHDWAKPELREIIDQTEKPHPVTLPPDAVEPEKPVETETDGA